MPMECFILKDKPTTIVRCPACNVYPFEPFMRGQVQKGWLEWVVELIRSRLSDRPPCYCAVICSDCKEIVGWENIDGHATVFRKWRQT